MSSIRFTDEQAMLAEIATKFFRDKWPIESVREHVESVQGFDPGLWQEMAELGWLSIAVPEEHGGLGLGLAELVPLVEPMGRHLLATPFVSTQLAVQALLHGKNEQRSRWLPRLAEGSIATMALLESSGAWDLEQIESRASVSSSSWQLSGEKVFVLDAKVADLLVVSVICGGAPALVLLERETIPSGALERETVIDETRRSYRLTLDGIEVSTSQVIEGASARAALHSVRDASLLLLSAEACGGIAGTLDKIVEYLTSRVQFGRLIGSYQGLKHPTVDILIGLERSRSLLYRAATVVDRGTGNAEEAEESLRMAHAQSTESFAFAGDRAIQFHGGFGFTYECDAQLYLRRALWSQYQLGDARHQRQRLAEIML